MKPDYQVVRDGEYCSVYKPVRLLALPDGGMICLTWQELCGELTKREKERLANVALNTSLTGQERGDAAVELVRLEMADDEKCEGIAAKAEEFVRTHSTEECEAHIRTEIARCKAMREGE